MIPVSCHPHPFDSRRVDYAVPAGLTIAEMIEIIQPNPVLRAHGVVFVGDQVIERALWHRVRPKPGSRVVVRLLPSGGGAGRIAAIVGLVIAVAVLTWVTWGTAWAFAPALLGAAGMFAINTFLPPPLPELSRNEGKDPTPFAVTGARNRAEPWGKLPFLLGRFKLVPPYAVMPYREIVGGEVYWRTIFALGHGPIAIESWGIGETDLSAFQGVEIEFRRGYWSMPDRGGWDASSGTFPTDPSFGDTYTCTVAGSVGGVAYAVGETITFNALAPAHISGAWDRDQGKPFALFPDDVFEEGLQVAVKAATPGVRASQANADELAVELVFERGLVHIQNSPPGKKADSTVGIRIEQSAAAAGVWTTVTTQTIVGRQSTPLYWGWRWKSAQYGAGGANRQYDVRISRLVADMDEERNFGNFTWVSLRTITAGNPVPVPHVALLAMRIKSSGQLTGVIDEFNVVGLTIARDWDAATSQWAWRPTSSPAALFRHVLQHPLRERPATDAQIDLAKMIYWDGVSRPAGCEFNGGSEEVISRHKQCCRCCTSKLRADASGHPPLFRPRVPPADRWGRRAECAKDASAATFEPARISRRKRRSYTCRTDRECSRPSSPHTRPA